MNFVEFVTEEGKALVNIAKISAILKHPTNPAWCDIHFEDIEDPLPVLHTYEEVKTTLTGGQ